MTEPRARHGRFAAVFALVATALGWTGCQGDGKRMQPVSVANRTLGPLSVAVAPALNLSGSSDFDPARFADLMASELSHAEGVSVIPVSRVLGVLAAQGSDGVYSPEQAMKLARRLGADAVLVFAVTEYDPYDPPSIGITAQLYGERPGPGGRSLDPVALSRQEQSPPAQKEQAIPGLLAQAQRVFDASHESVASEIRRFASYRGGDDSAFGWRKFVVSQQHFIRFCCHATIRALFSGNDPVLADVCGDGVGMP